MQILTWHGPVSCPIKDYASALNEARMFLIPF